MAGGAAAIGGVLLAACGTSKAPRPPPPASAKAASPAPLTGDLKVAALAASLENLGIYAYGAGIKAAQAGKLGTVPPAIVTFATTAMAQHQQHAAAWNAALTGAGKAKVTETDPALTPTVNQMFGQVTDVAGLAKLALAHREHRGPDLPGQHLGTVEGQGHRHVGQHPPGRDAARRHLEPGARQLPGAQRLQPDQLGPDRLRPRLTGARPGTAAPTAGRQLGVAVPHPPAHCAGRVRTATLRRSAGRGDQNPELSVAVTFGNTRSTIQSG